MSSNLSRRFLRHLPLLVLVGLVGCGAPEPVLKTTPLERMDLANTIVSIGVLQPVTTVQVGSQVSGQVSELLADFNDQVTAGQVLARIDPAPFSARLDEARADLAIARANINVEQAALDEAKAELAGARAQLAEAERSVDRRTSLRNEGAVTGSDLDAAATRKIQASSGVLAAEAKLRRQYARIELAEAQVARQTASVALFELELEHTVIRAPIAGAVILRNVDLGQTVAASLQAPVLFRIAGDLARMELSVQVDEADIGQVRAGLPLSFTVDAYPGARWPGEVTQVRQAGQYQANLVTYTVLAGVDNSDLRLLPGMTATVSLLTALRRDVLAVPNRAIRLPLPASIAATPPTGANAWVWRSGVNGVEAVAVEVGMGNGQFSEVIADGLAAGDPVVVAVDG